MLDTLKQELSCAIAYIKEQNLRALNKGDITLFDRANCLVIAEPADLELIVSPDNMLITDMSGNIIEGSGQPAAVLQAHLEIYRSFPGVSAVVHSHSPYATAWAQAGRDIPVYGTGHLDTFADAIPCTRAVTPAEAENGYAVAAGCCIVETFQKKALDPDAVPAVLLFQHGAFVWGRDAMEAARRAAALEQLAMLAYLTEKINPDIKDIQRSITPVN